MQCLYLYLRSFYTVELMRSGYAPAQAAAAAVQKIARVYPSVSAGVVAVNIAGDYGKHICDLRQTKNIFLHCFQLRV